MLLLLYKNRTFCHRPETSTKPGRSLAAVPRENLTDQPTSGNLDCNSTTTKQKQSRDPQENLVQTLLPSSTHVSLLSLSGWLVSLFFA